MTLMKWNTDSELADLFDNLFGNTSKEEMEEKQYECAPSTNIIEKNDGYELHMALPGVQKKDVKISLEKNVLSIASDKKASDDDANYTRREFMYGTFCRSFTLPDTIDTEKISADFKNGILKVKLPKKEETRISKQIRIS